MGGLDEEDVCSKVFSTHLALLQIGGAELKEAHTAKITNWVKLS